MKQMPPDMKHIIFANMNINLYTWPLTFRKVVQQQIWGDVVINSSFLRRYFMNLTVKKFTKIGPLLSKISWK